MVYKPTDEEVLRHAVEQVLEVDLTREHGLREGTGWHDPKAGDSFVKRGIMRKEDGGRLFLMDSAVVRVLRVAVDAAVADLMSSDPPAEKLPWPEDMDEYDDFPVRLIMNGPPGKSTPQVR